MPFKQNGFPSWKNGWQPEVIPDIKDNSLSNSSFALKIPLIFLHVSFQGVVEGVLERAGVVGVVQPASTSDPASKQPCNNLQLPLRDDSLMKSWKTGKMSDSVGCAAEKGQILGR